MDSLRLQAVAARVVAWHNRHPLARRITAAQVHSIGYVALPYAVAASAGAVEPGGLDSAPAASAPAATAPPGGSLRERALARAARQSDAGLPVLDAAVTMGPRPSPAALKAVFDEDFIAPLSPRRVARWAARHGRMLPAAPGDGPLREVHPLPVPPDRRPVMVYVLTAAIESGTARHRLLLGAGDVAPVLGHRVLGKPRVALLGLGLLLPLAVGALLPLWPRGADAPTAQAAHQAASAAAEADPAASAPEADTVAVMAPPSQEEPGAPPAEPPNPGGHGAAPGGSPHAPEHADAGPAAPQDEVPPPAPHGAATAGTHAAADPHSHEATLQAPAAAAPEDVEPRLGRVQLPPLNLPIKDEAKAAARLARQQRQAEMAQAAASAPAPAATNPVTARAAAASPTALPGQAMPPAAAIAAMPPAIPRGQPAFAVSTRVLRTRAEAEQIAAAMSALLQPKAAAADTPGVRVDVLPQGEDWRVVGWPFAAAAQADKARALLATRGMRVAVVDF